MTTTTENQLSRNQFFSKVAQTVAVSFYFFGSEQVTVKDLI